MESSHSIAPEETKKKLKATEVDCSLSPKSRQLYTAQAAVLTYSDKIERKVKSE